MAAMTMLVMCSRAHVTKSPMIIVLVLSRTLFVSGSSGHFVGMNTWSLMLLVVKELCVTCCDADGSLCSMIAYSKRKLGDDCCVLCSQRGSRRRR
jgi:hypothetical protein